MFVCVCCNANEAKIYTIIEENPEITVDEFEEHNICNNCYRCKPVIERMIKENARQMASNG